MKWVKRSKKPVSLTRNQLEIQPTDRPTNERASKQAIIQTNKHKTTDRLNKQANKQSTNQSNNKLISTPFVIFTLNIYEKAYMVITKRTMGKMNIGIWKSILYKRVRYKQCLQYIQ